jgi:hypothetical protein
MDGDRNTRYYHLKTINRRRYNNVIMLRNDFGEWVEDPVQLQSMVNNFYYDLFSKSNERWEWKQTDVTFPILDRETFDMLGMPIEDQEVKKALFSMSPWKAPGPDGYPAGFYQQGWNVVGSSIIEFVRAVWNKPEVINLVNATDICLIPKVARPEFVNQFRPISLCNTIYKIVSKVIVSRLQNCIPSIVSPFQTGFVPGRRIHENIVVAQELSHSMNKMTGTVGYFAIKVDLSKACDMMHWDFVEYMLREVGLPNLMINVIMQGVTSVKINVKWNGIRADYFRPTRGIRQVDPISPYLFVMGMDKLSHLNCHVVNQGEWKPIKVGRNGPSVSHLMFDDDLLLFGQATVLQMQCVMRILDEFCTLSGQRVSNEKTSIMFSKNVPRSVRSQLIGLSGFREAVSLGKYLGVPLTGRAPRRADFHYIIEKVQSKLTAWKAKNLTFAGRVTLAKSVMEVVPIYPMMTNQLPQSCIDEIEKIERNFIWGDNDETRKVHAVRWADVTKPKW